jgi:hypothetical protein
MSSNEIVIPENAGLGELRKLLAQAENKVSAMGKTLRRYEVAHDTAKATYDDKVTAGKVLYEDEPNPTMINAKAQYDARTEKEAYTKAKNLFTLAKGRYKDMLGKRDTLKAMVKSEQFSY